MTNQLISVVMGIYNEESRLDATIQSILTQQDVELEFIIVNDGSTDASESIIRKKMAEDSRITLINQNNVGLTKSLIKGCAHAKGYYIARQDCGDTSSKTRLRDQLDAFIANPDLAMISAGTAFTAPDGEVFNELIQTEQEARHGLKSHIEQKLVGPPHHGSVMFRRDFYKQVGGYRAPFYVAQDLDLWTRLVELGDHISLSDILYFASADKNSISSLRRSSQIMMTQIILKCCQARKEYGHDEAILQKLEPHSRIDKPVDKSAKLKSDADFYYYIASNLRDRGNPASKKYLQKALRANPFHWKARLKSLFPK